MMWSFTIVSGLPWLHWRVLLAFQIDKLGNMNEMLVCFLLDMARMPLDYWRLYSIETLLWNWYN